MENHLRVSLHYCKSLNISAAETPHVPVYPEKIFSVSDGKKMVMIINIWILDENDSHWNVHYTVIPRILQKLSKRKRWEIIWIVWKHLPTTEQVSPSTDCIGDNYIGDKVILVTTKICHYSSSTSSGSQNSTIEILNILGEIGKMPYNVYNMEVITS